MKKVYNVIDWLRAKPLNHFALESFKFNEAEESGTKEKATVAVNGQSACNCNFSLFTIEEF